MIIIDLDAIKTGAHRSFVKKSIADNLSVRQSRDGQRVFVPTRPIYWQSRRRFKIQDLEAENLPVIGHAMTFPSVVHMIDHMIKDIDAEAERHGMVALGRFRRPVKVITDKYMGQIESYGATPLPLFLVNEGNA